MTQANCKSTPGAVDRRAVLAGAASVAAAGPLPVAAAASGAADPLIALWHRREALIPLFQIHTSDEDWDRIGDLVHVVDDEIIATPAATLDGWRVKVRLLRTYVPEDGSSGLCGADGDALAAVLEDAERLLGRGGAA
jgi:hypothetical protein